MNKLSIAERLKVYTRYIGQKVILTGQDVNAENQLGVLTGVKENSIQLSIDNQSRWIPLYDDFELYDIKLVLKPLKLLTDSIKQTANNLPVQNFITQYYIQLGFDMPMFFSPGHPQNCKYAAELGLATYNTAEEYFQPDLIAV